MQEFIDYLIEHEPTISECEFDDHYTCSWNHLDGPRYHDGFSEYLRYHVKEFEKVNADQQ